MIFQLNCDLYMIYFATFPFNFQLLPEYQKKTGQKVKHTPNLLTFLFCKRMWQELNFRKWVSTILVSQMKTNMGVGAKKKFYWKVKVCECCKSPWGFGGGGEMQGDFIWKTRAGTNSGICKGRKKGCRDSSYSHIPSTNDKLAPATHILCCSEIIEISSKTSRKSVIYIL